MHVEVADLFAERQVDLKPGTTAPIGVRAGGQDRRQPRREGGTAPALAQDLVSIIDEDVADGSRAAVAAGHRYRVRELMSDCRNRPFLCERALPLAGRTARPAEDVLEDALLLVEGFLDEERIVEDAERLRLRQRRRGCDANGNSRQQEPLAEGTRHRPNVVKSINFSNQTYSKGLMGATR